MISNSNFKSQTMDNNNLARMNHLNRLVGMIQVHETTKRAVCGQLLDLPRSGFVACAARSALGLLAALWRRMGVIREGGLLTALLRMEIIMGRGFFRNIKDYN